MASSGLLAILGGLIIGFGILGLIVYVLLIIAMWKIFSKAGESGWKSLIPIYNVYIYYKIAGMKKYFWILVCASIIVGIIQTILGKDATASNILSIILAIFSIVVSIMHCYRLSKSFGKGIGYTLGLLFLPNIFTLILGFGSAEYVGTGKE